jgi:nicotinamidase-related amidase
MSKTALLLIDVVNTFDFPQGHALHAQARRAGSAIVALKRRAEARNVPVVYCNDHFGHWRADFRAVVDLCTASEAIGSAFVEALRPGERDYFLLKPRHSAFYETALSELLSHLHVKRLILAGIAGDGCIHSTATDAHIRKFETIVCQDATASVTAVRNARALTHLREVGYARLAAARHVRF